MRGRTILGLTLITALLPLALALLLSWLWF